MFSTTLAPADDRLKPPMTKSDVAALSHADIAELSPGEMLRVIAVADLPFAQKPGLAYQSPETLRKLTHLACQCCRNQGF